MLVPLLLALLGGLLLSLSWPDTGYPGLLFVALVPILMAVDHITKKQPAKNGRRVLWTLYPGFLLFNIYTSWWIWYASDWGSVAAITITAFIQSLVFWVFVKIKTAIGAHRALIALPFLWISLEAFQHWWDLSWPWLHFGMAFATKVEWIQWYEFTGVFGGTLWVWLVNLSLFVAIKKATEKKLPVRKLILRGVLILVPLVGLPIAGSVWMYHSYEEHGKPIQIVIVQPNLDAYTEKFDLPETTQTQKFLTLATPLMNASTDYVIGPETMLPWGFTTDAPQESQSIDMIKNWLGNYPNAHLVAGASTRRFFEAHQKMPATARPSRTPGYFYESFNTSFQISRADSIPLYHKSKLVVGVEMMPYTWLLNPLLGSLIIDLGGTTGTLGTQNHRTAFVHDAGKTALGTAICYESIYGEFVSEYVKAGAEFLAIITNDGWWQNTPGHRQHMQYARLRAIETRKSIARSANTGISAFINQRGDVLQSIPYGVEGAIKQEILANNTLTVYTKSGDVIKRWSVFIALFVILAAVVQGKLRRSKPLI